MSPADSPRPFATTRRTVLRAGAATAAIVGASSLADGARARAQDASGAAQGADGGHYVFQHGVASGDPMPGSVLLWTRATSHPGDIPGAGEATPVRLRWEVSADEAFGRVIASGDATAEPSRDNTVKVDATGLPEDAWLYYRFTVADGEYEGQVSPVGRTRTAPATDSNPERLGIALTSCANWEAGYFSAYRDMADNDAIDVIMCVGDYIYEYPAGEYTGKQGAVRNSEPANETITLADYRRRYGHYRTDPDLQAAHLAKPWIVTWDDHEIANDAHATGAENHDPETEGDYIARRDAAVQAYLEWLPVRATPFSEGGHLYRTFNHGTLAEIVMLDLRTYRDQPPEFRSMADTDDESRTMLGSEQMSWLHGQWSTSNASWNLVGNSVMITPVLIPPMDPQATRAVTELMGLPEEGVPYNLDQWDGFAAERRRLIAMMAEQGLDNVVFLTGDIHSSWACDVPVAPGRYPGDGVAATEIVCPSVTSSNIDDILKLPQRNAISISAEQALMAANRHIKWIEFDHHGYVALEVRPDDIVAEWRFLGEKELQGQPLAPAMTYRVTRGSTVSPA